MSIEAVDQTARDDAVEARSMIQTHERVCEERARESSTWRSATTEKLNDIKGDVRTAIFGSIGLLLSAIAYLILHKGL